MVIEPGLLRAMGLCLLLPCPAAVISQMRRSTVPPFYPESGRMEVGTRRALRDGRCALLVFLPWYTAQVRLPQTNRWRLSTTKARERSPMTPTLGNGKICYIEIPARDVRRSAEFYEKVF